MIDCNFENGKAFKMSIPKKLVWLLLVLYLFGAFFKLGGMYFQHEESRRAIIALEMNYTHNYITPQVLGRDYFKKPPLHNIMIAIFFKIFGENEFAARSISVLSMIGIAYLIYSVLLDIVGFEAALFGAASFGLSFIAYFQYGMLAETDMFFSFLVFLSILCIYYEKLFLGSVFTGFALLTKGFPALHYFYLTLFVYALYQKRIKQIFFSKQVIFGGLIVILMFLGWLELVSKGDIYRFSYALGFLVQESGRRVLSVEHIGKIFEHFLLFPISFWVHLLPFSVVLLFFFNSYFRENFKEILSSNAKIKKLFNFTLIAFIPNFLIYAIIPDGRIRYTLVLFGVLGFLFGIIYYELEYLEIFEFKKIFSWLFILLSVLAIFGMLFDIGFVKGNDYWICIAVSVPALASFYLIKKLNINQTLTLLIFITIFTILSKLLFDATYKSYLYTYFTNYRLKAKETAKIILQYKPLYIMTNASDLKFFFYLERDVGVQFHPINPRKHGIVITKNRGLVKNIFYTVELPKHIYYVGKKLKS